MMTMANFPVISTVCVTVLACAVGTKATAVEVHEIDTTSGRTLPWGGGGLPPAER